MYIPKAIRQQFLGPGGAISVGAALLSLILAGIALGWLGVLAVIAVLFVLLFVEVWREAAGVVKDLAKSEASLASANQMAGVVPDLRSRIDELQKLVQILEEEKRRPRASLEETLEALVIHLNRLRLVLKHRAMSKDVHPIPVTRAMIEEDGTAELTGVVESGVDLVSGEPLVVVGGDGESGSEASIPIRIDGSQMEARFALSGLPVELAEEIEEEGSVSPNGYTLYLAGLTLKEYEKRSDADLQEMQNSMKKAVEALTRTLAGEPPSNEAT